MKIIEAVLDRSYACVDDIPVTLLPEFAFIGRSNVGKSSLINYLTQRKNLAVTSSTPGKTTLIHYFLINQQFYLVDLPGYGYAQRSHTTRLMIKSLLKDYLTKRKSVKSFFLLIDARHPNLPIDHLFMQLLGKYRLPFSIILTKIDKLSSGQLKKHIHTLENTLKKEWDRLPNIFTISSTQKKGREEILQYLEFLLKMPHS